MLSSFAQSATESLGRLIPEPEHPFRNCFQRDRDRVVHSTAFRRLDGKTQVFLNGKGDYYRTRLTHTIEVASISRTIARSLGLNEYLVEAIALAHDLGHSPSGHAGEKRLNILMAEHGGFNHNEQSVRIVEILEESYPQHHGLNLSYEVLEGLRKHHREFKTPQGKAYPSHSLEAQVANIADEIAYNHHDLDDGLEAGLIDPHQLDQLAIWQRAKNQALKELGYETENRTFLLRCFINDRVEDLITTSRAAIAAAGVDSVEKVRASPHKLIHFSPTHEQENRELRRFLSAHLEHHSAIAAPHEEACVKIERLFEHFINNPHLLGKRYFSRIEEDGKHRAVCDYIAGMTDRYVTLHYDSLQ
jgi:dGTPase